MELAYRWIARKPHSVWEIRQKLRDRASEDTIDEIVGKLQAYKLLDDLNFSSNYASYRMRERGLGPARIRVELSHRGIVPEIIERAVEAATREVSEEEAASAALAKFLRKRPKAAGPKEQRRAYTHLYRAGFSPEVIRRVMGRRNMAEDLDTFID